MSPRQFFGQNAHFAISLIAALAAFAVFWLIFDAWLERRKRTEFMKWLGFGLLAVGYGVNAATLSQGGPSQSHLTATIDALGFGLRIIGYILIAAGEILDPILPRPQSKTIEEALLATPAGGGKGEHLGGIGMVGSAVKLTLLPLTPLIVAALYFRRATVGLERHLRPVAVAFGFIGAYELLSDTQVLQNTTNPSLYRLINTYGPVWWLAQAVLLVGAIVLGRWVWQYLTKRLFSQLFIVLVTASVLIFFVTTVGFSFLLMRNISSEALSELTTASGVLSYAVSSRQAEVAAQAETLSENSAVSAAISANDRTSLASKLANYLAVHQLSSVVITNTSGQVLLRAEDPARWGDSLSGDTPIRRGLIGETTTSVAVKAGVIAPTIELIAARPIRDGNNVVIGVVEASRSVDNGFVDEIKSSTGLDSTVYGGVVQAATTLTMADGTTRSVGIKETSAQIIKTVVTEGKNYHGSSTFENRNYLAAYTPLKDADGNSVAMLVVSRPEDTLFAVTGHTIQLTFLMSIALLFASIWPIYLISRRLSEQMK